MRTSRLEAFSDGVLAIIITVMVLQLRHPQSPDLAGLTEVVPSILAYLMSFIYVGIYWNNHHHMFQLVERIDGVVLWANLHLLFWLSLLPFSTTWMDQTHMARVPTVTYGVNLLMAAVAYALLQRAVFHREGSDSKLRAAVAEAKKEKASVGLYILGIGLTYLSPWAGLACYITVAGMWLVPDPRVERAFYGMVDPPPAAE